MAIRRSSSASVEGLIGALLASGRDEARREAALARLAVIGARAVGHLLSSLERAGAPEQRLELLAALERIPDPRVIAPLLALLEPSSASPQDAQTAVRIAVIRAVRPLLASAHGTPLLERLTVLALDSGEPLSVRRAAFDALSDLPARTLEPVRRRLREDADPAVRALADATGEVRDAVSAPADAGQVADDPAAVLAYVGREGSEAPLPVLHGLLAPVRAREADGGRRRADWTAVRGALHVALARRDSSVGLYDLREAFEEERLHPLPADFTAAMRLIGDASCLEPLARAWLHAPAAGRSARARAWRDEIREAFEIVLRRERAPARRRAVTQIQQRWRGAAELRNLSPDAFSTPSRTSRASSTSGRT